MNELHPPIAPESGSSRIPQPAYADPVPEPAAPHRQPRQTSIRIYSHSSLLFWWPVWVIGYAMAALTWWHGRPESVGSSGQAMAWVHPSNNPGVI